LVTVTETGELLRQLWQTLSVLGLGFGFAIVTGMAVGIAMGMFPTLRRILDPYVNAFYAMPTVALVPLGLWFVISLLRQPALDHAVIAGWFAKPLQAVLAALLGAALLWHSMQGWQVVLEDYVGGRLRGFSITLARIAHTGAALAPGFGPFPLGPGARPWG